MSEEKFQSVKKGGEKKYKCGISGVRKKKELKGEYWREKKNQSVFRVGVCVSYTLGGML